MFNRTHLKMAMRSQNTQFEEFVLYPIFYDNQQAYLALLRM